MAPEETRTPAPIDRVVRCALFTSATPYPAPIDNLDRHRDLYRNPDRRRAVSLLLWPMKKQRATREILVAGCGTSPAATQPLLGFSALDDTLQSAVGRATPRFRVSKRAVRNNTLEIPQAPPIANRLSCLSCTPDPRDQRWEQGWA